MGCIQDTLSSRVALGLSALFSLYAESVARANVYCIQRYLAYNHMGNVQCCMLFNVAGLKTTRCVFRLLLVDYVYPTHRRSIFDITPMHDFWFAFHNRRAMLFIYQLP